MKAFLFLLVLLVAGCVATPSQNVSMFTIDASPSDLFTSGSGKATMLFTNTGNSDVRNVNLGIFNAGALAECKGGLAVQDRESYFDQCLQLKDCNFVVGDVKKDSFAQRECTLEAPDTIEQDVITTEVDARASFDSTLGGTDTISAMSENEYRIEQAKGAVPMTSPVYVHDDGRVKATVSFSEQMPVINRGKKLYMYIDIANVGNGRIDTIDAGAVTVTQPGIFALSTTTTTPIEECKSKGGGSICVKCPDGSYHFGSTDIKDCPSYTPAVDTPLPISADSLPKINCPSQKLYIQGASFPRMTCEITLPNNVNYLSDYTLILSINYPYEVRASHTVQVRR